MRKTVDVFLKDKLVASYPVVVEAIDRPADDDFIARVKKQMRRRETQRQWQAQDSSAQDDGEAGRQESGEAHEAGRIARQAHVSQGRKESTQERQAAVALRRLKSCGERRLRPFATIAPRTLNSPFLDLVH